MQQPYARKAGADNHLVNEESATSCCGTALPGTYHIKRLVIPILRMCHAIVSVIGCLQINAVRRRWCVANVSFERWHLDACVMLVLRLQRCMRVGNNAAKYTDENNGARKKECWTSLPGRIQSD